MGGNNSMDITTKDQRFFRFKFINQIQLQNSYAAIMLSTQVTKHSNLFAYKFKDGMIKSQSEQADAKKKPQYEVQSHGTVKDIVR